MNKNSKPTPLFRITASSQKSSRSGEGLKKSVEYFNQAIEQEPNYALAYSGLAEAYALFSSFAVSLPQDSYPKAKAAVKKRWRLMRHSPKRMMRLV